LRAITRLYNEQASRGKVFLHEQPDGLADLDVGLTALRQRKDVHICRRAGEKSFWLFNSLHVLNALETVAYEAPSGAPERYSVDSLAAIRKGLRDHRRVWTEGSTFCIGEMDAGPTLEEPDMTWNLEPMGIRDSTKDAFYDNLTGFELSAEGVRAARRLEMEFLLELGVWSVVDVAEAWATTGRGPIPVSWADTNRGDAEVEDLRSRFVVNETKRASGPMDPAEVFNATPPLEALIIQGSLMMSVPRPTLGDTPAQDVVWRFLDISRAHPNYPMRRDVFTRLPEEHPQYSADHIKCGKLVMTLYGTRDADQNFELAIYDTLTEARFDRGDTNPCCYRHEQRGLSLYHHGDDFGILGTREQTEWAGAAIGKRCIVKDRGCLGPRSGDLAELLFLHRSVTYWPPGSRGGERVDYALGPRHAEVLVAQQGLDTRSKGVVTPGEKVTVTEERPTRRRTAVRRCG
jgi:hypothetical protein